MTGFELATLLLMLVGLIGIVIQVIPGSLLIAFALLVWAWQTGTTIAWVAFAVGALAIAGAWVLKWLLAGRRLKQANVHSRSLVIGGVLGVIGFFVIPVVGLFLLFVLGVFAAERVRLRDTREAWVSTKAALVATGITILVELAGGLVAVAACVAAMIFA